MLDGHCFVFAGKSAGNHGYSHTQLQNIAKKFHARVLVDFSPKQLKRIKEGEICYLLVAEDVSTTSTKFQYAKDNNIPILYTNWLIECKDAQKKLDIAGFEFVEGGQEHNDNEDIQHDNASEESSQTKRQTQGKKRTSTEENGEEAEEEEEREETEEREDEEEEAEEQEEEEEEVEVPNQKSKKGNKSTKVRKGTKIVSGDEGEDTEQDDTDAEEEPHYKGNKDASTGKKTTQKSFTKETKEPRKKENLSKKKDTMAGEKHSRVLKNKYLTDDEGQEDHPMDSGQEENNNANDDSSDDGTDVQFGRRDHASSSRSERKKYHLGPSPPRNREPNFDTIELIRDPDDEPGQRKRVRGKILFTVRDIYLAVALPGKNHKHPGQERVYLILGSSYPAQKSAFRLNGGKNLASESGQTLTDVDVSKMLINIVASNEKDTVSYILARRPDSVNFLLYSRSTFNQVFGNKAGDHVINVRRIKTGQKKFTPRKKNDSIPSEYYKAQGVDMGHT